MTSPTTTFPSMTSSRPATARAFTLIELVLVMLIVSAMVTVAVPYATRSNEALALDQACRDVAEGIKYAISHSMDTRRPTRVTIDLKDHSYVIETAGDIHEQDFQPLDDSRGAVRYLGSKIHVLDVEGFDVTGKDRYGLVFDPEQRWPRAALSLAIKDTVKTITVAGKAVHVEARPF